MGLRFDTPACPKAKGGVCGGYDSIYGPPPCRGRSESAFSPRQPALRVSSHRRQRGQEGSCFLSALLPSLAFIYSLQRVIQPQQIPVTVKSWGERRGQPGCSHRPPAHRQTSGEAPFAMGTDRSRVRGSERGWAQGNGLQCTDSSSGSQPLQAARGTEPATTPFPGTTHTRTPLGHSLWQGMRSELTAASSFTIFISPQILQEQSGGKGTRWGEDAAKRRRRHTSPPCAF